MDDLRVPTRRMPRTAMIIGVVVSILIVGFVVQWVLNYTERYELACSSNMPFIPDAYVIASATVNGHGHPVATNAEGRPFWEQGDERPAKATVTHRDGVVRLTGTWTDSYGDPHTCTDTLTLEGM